MEMYIWLGVTVVFLLIEAASVGLVSIWFAAGSLAGLIAAAFGAPVPVQIIVALAVSTLCLWALRPLAKKYICPKITKTNVEAVVGKSAVVTENIDNLHSCGAVKVGAVTWTARSTDGASISAGATVKVDRVEGVKLFVTKV